LLTWPVIVANITIPLVGIADTAVMGRMPEPSYIGAVAVGATIFSSIYWLFGFLRMATTGLAAQAAGAGDSRELSRVAARGLGVAIFISLLVVMLQWPIEALMFWIFEASEQVERFARTYFSIRIWSAPALMIYMVCLGMLFGTQRVRTTLWLSVLLNITNVVLDILFVLGFGWGVAGVAAATLISEWLAALIALAVVIRAITSSTGWGSHWLVDLWQGSQVRRLFQVGGNLIIRSFFVQLPFFVFTVVGARFGDVVLAANSVLMQFFFIMAFALDAFAHTAETLSGYAFGARDRSGLRLAVRYSLLWAVICSALIALGFALSGDWLIASLTVLPEVRAAAGALLPWAVASPLAAVLAFHMDGVFIGTTRTAELRNSMFVAAALFLLVLWLAIEPLGNTGLWLAMTAFLAVRGLLLVCQYPRLERRADEVREP
jgi:MATE family multidrug resistance protein